MDYQIIFEVEKMNVNNNSIQLLGRAYEDFTCKDKLFVKILDKDDYVSIELSKIITYRVELDFLSAGMTGAIMLKSINNSTKPTQYSKYIYRVEEDMASQVKLQQG